MTKSNRTLVFVLIAVVLVIGFFGLFKFSNKSATNPNASGNLASASFALFPNARNIQPFALQESNGASFNDHSLKGHWSLVFFCIPLHWNSRAGITIFPLIRYHIEH